MNRLERKFKELRRQGKKAFAAYVTAGDPRLSMTGKILLTLEKSGADIIELGIPFSDPLADGPTIQAASQRALKKRVGLDRIFKMVKVFRRKIAVPIVFMTYYNPVLKYGLERFFKGCSTSGVDGIIIPDLPEEEAKEMIKLGAQRDVATIFLAAPTSTAGRMKKIAKASRGFIYLVSLTGVTGMRSHLPEDVLSNVRLIKSLTDKPVLVGFGVSTKEQARRIAAKADGVIVGSAIVKIVEDNLNDEKRLLSKVSNFAKNLAKAVHNE